MELVETDDTYLELWERQSIQDRGFWLIEHGFRITASKERVTVSQGDVSATVELGKPERITPTRHTEQTYWGKCGCGCGIDLYGAKCRRKEYANAAHRERAKRQRERAAADPQEQVEQERPRKCECGCGTDIHAASNATGNQKRYVNATHKKRGERQRARAERQRAAADPQEP